MDRGGCLGYRPVMAAMGEGKSRPERSRSIAAFGGLPAFYRKLRRRAAAQQCGRRQSPVSLSAIRPLQVHLVSTAYVCGLVTTGVVREVNHPGAISSTSMNRANGRPNRYGPDGRPSCAPASSSENTPTGTPRPSPGWYMIAKGGYLLDQFLKLNPALDRRKLDIQIPMNPNATLEPGAGGLRGRRRVQHPGKSDSSQQNIPSHPHRPAHATHSAIEVICRRFDLGGIEFVDPGTPLRGT